jgi:aminoglycoside phosphotransferase (APT) family kinase protein
VEISVGLVRRLVVGQFPQWSDLPIGPVDRQGNDNRTFRLGDHLAVRLPSQESYVAGISKEDMFLPLLAEHLAVPVPAPVATGRPAGEYPYPWSVRHWLPGDVLDSDPPLDRPALARDLGAFLRELRRVPASDGPAAGLHSFYRGCHPSVYGDQVQQALLDLGDQVDVAGCRAVWLEAMRSAWLPEPVWFHGDIAPGNLLTAAGRLSAVIDFGTCGVGDPACDLVIAWTFLSGEERQIFAEAVGLPDDAWARARGWALWKALVTLTDPGRAEDETQRLTLARVLEEPVVAAR